MTHLPGRVLHLFPILLIATGHLDDSSAWVCVAFVTLLIATGHVDARVCVDSWMDGHL